MSWDLIAVAAAAVVLLLVLLAPSGRVQLPGFRGGVPRNALPWVIGGWVPSPGAFVPSLLLLLATGFSSTAALIMAAVLVAMAIVCPPRLISP